MSTQNPFSLDGKVAVVTGASKGMGAAIALLGCYFLARSLGGMA